jgi:hypothetical protein
VSLQNQLPRAPAPTPRYGASLAYNSTGQYVLMFGGCQYTLTGSSGASSCGPLSNVPATWEYANGTWKLLTVTGSVPSARWDASLVYDATSNYFLLFGGCAAPASFCSSGSVLDDTWTFGDGVWKQITLTVYPSARGDASMAWDGLDNVVVLFGGIGPSPCTGGVCGDTWTYSAGTWTKCTIVTCTTSGPSARWGAMIAYDPTLAPGAAVVMTEGNGSAGVPLTDTWQFTVAAGWTRLTSINYPNPGRYDGAMVYDATDGYLVLVGGVRYDLKPLSDIWVLKAGSVWTPLTAGSTGLGTRWGMGMVFDPVAGPNGFTLAFGGSNASAESLGTPPSAGGVSPGQGDTWALIGGSWPSSVAPTPAWFDIELYG